ncbi:MAG: mechanosensitive channel MscS [bacterium ADurb.Bin429]|nr:MAG: mechanosensitive channel MscS [bacterium ADurb.Bin429]
MLESLRNWLEDPDVLKVVFAVIGAIVILVAVRFIQHAINRYIHDSGTRYQARKLTTFLGYFAVVLLISLIFRVRLSGLAIFLGVLGAAIAFSLQEVIASIAGWLAISLGGVYNVGDRVQVGEIKGDVIDVSLLRTTLMEIGEWVQADLYTGRIVRVSNSIVFNSPVYNFSGDFPYVWDEIRIPVMYGSDVRRARAIVEAIAEEVVGEMTEPALTAWARMVIKYRIENATIRPMVTLVANDNWVEFTLRYIVDYKKRRSTQDRLFTRLLEEIDRTAGTVKMASMTVQVVGMPEMTVRLRGNGEQA